ncbi:hypothetical protein [Mesorhizobium sp.]|uniref:hypothetical protein n=1 Tax=Mesorhizobium sp. TaxID=1871066 RepID=UPI0025798533|nr:hypothetical protein [Mesorhizobium sp.]
MQYDTRHFAPIGIVRRCVEQTQIGRLLNVPHLHSKFTVSPTRRAALLKSGQTINCINPECTERWDAVFEGDSINFQRRTIAVNCRRCGHPTVIAERPALELPLNTMAYFICEQAVCQEKNPVMWRLMQAAPGNAAPQKW